jgi:hypothetical protein
MLLELVLLELSASESPALTHRTNKSDRLLFSWLLYQHEVRIDLPFAMQEGVGIPFLCSRSELATNNPTFVDALKQFDGDVLVLFVSLKPFWKAVHQFGQEREWLEVGRDSEWPFDLVSLKSEVNG